ncbi:HAD family hydrolase [Saccharospirillum mangrovi]|uniref:HAD family hydrolase n=1 Tax=Saccharospirillum mangrovi TaxID=2161747 RepID=UPI000D3D4826|nr:HAD family phosphatase [Saccharospirillum mangrovi]
MTTPIKHLIFDMGGVLIRLQWHQQASLLLGRDVPFEQIHALWGSAQSTHAFETGQLDFDAFTDALIDEFQIPLSRNDVQNRFRAMLDADFDDAVPLLKDLKADGRYTLSLLSNTNPCHLAMVQERNTIWPLLDRPFTSLDFGLMKPDPAIYRAVLNALNAQPEECWFFDDGIHNVEAARAIGINAEQVFGPEDIRRVLKEQGVFG